jgi:plasmid maintenance system antidote protein VapI
MVFHSTEDLLWEIQKYMKKNDITQKELAINMHTTSQNVQQILNGKNTECKTIIRIFDALNLQFDLNFLPKDDIK